MKNYEHIKPESFRIRASAAGILMTGTIGLTEKQQAEMVKLQEKDMTPKGLTPLQSQKLADLECKHNNPELPQTVKTYLDAWLLEAIYGKTKEFQSKYTDKGVEMEDEAIDLVNERYDTFYIKNETSAGNEFFTGTCDILPNRINHIRDIKCVWNCFNMPLFDIDEDLNHNYFLQGQVYMELYDKDEFFVDYCLVNTPEFLQLKEERDLSYKNGVEPDRYVHEFVSDLHTYDNVDLVDRVKSFNFKRDKKVIEQLKERVILARKYLRQRLDERINSLKNN